jgi:hypothetical protein
MSAPVRHRSRTASSPTVGMRMATSSPARCNRASRRQSRRSVSGLVAGRPGDQRRRDHLAAHVHAVQQPGQLEAGRAGLVAGSQPGPIREPRHEPANRRRIVGDPLDVGDLLVRVQDPDRDRVFVDVQAEMDRGEMGDTNHGRLPPYVGSARLSVGDPRHMRTGAGRSMLTKGLHLLPPRPNATPAPVPVAHGVDLAITRGEQGAGMSSCPGHVELPRP